MVYLGGALRGLHIRGHLLLLSSLQERHVGLRGRSEDRMVVLGYDGGSRRSAAWVIPLGIACIWCGVSCATTGGLA